VLRSGAAIWRMFWASRKVIGRRVCADAVAAMTLEALTAKTHARRAERTRKWVRTEVMVWVRDGPFT